MADAHGRSVVETNTINAVCVVVNICVFSLNVIKQMFIFISYSAHLLLASAGL